MRIIKDNALGVFCALMIAAGIIAAIFSGNSGATSFPPSTLNDTINNDLLSVTTSNANNSLNVEYATTHSIQIVTLCTNAVSNVISASLDGGTSYSAILTNSSSSNSTNLYSFIGYRFGYLKAVFTQTTANGSTNFIKYLGGRQ